MEAVKAFNSELYSLNDYKPPISKAKMTQITKAAIKAIKFYKHVVQSVEKFIQKCKPEYKVPGLYVIDSIVRQSRHQFGQEKDVFAPRFSKNIISTFQNLYRCPADEKSKVVRVLNLWQKNNVFKSDIIQPLLDMAAGLPPPSVTPVLPSTAAPVSSNTPGTPVTPATPANVVQGLPDSWASQIANTDTLTAVAQLLQSPQGQQLQQLVQNLQMQQQKPQPSLLQALDAGLVVQLQALTAQLTAAAAAANTLTPLEQSLSFNKKLLDRFDFTEEPEQTEESKKDATTSQLPLVSESVNNSLFHQLAEHLQQQNLTPAIEQFRQQFLEQQQPLKERETQDMTFGSDHSESPSQSSSQQQLQEAETKADDYMDIQQQDMEIDEGQDTVEEEIFEPEEKKPSVSSRSRTHSRSPRKRRSRSRSGSRKRKHRKRSRSRSRERKRKSSRSYSSERRAREREKERQKKGLPPIRSKTLSVCSTTLWVGQVDKKATQQDLTNVFEEFGQIELINMIPPRGCAYICMVHRQDAFRALQKLSTSSCKIGSKVIKIAWALNKGVKTEYKQFWDVDLGVTYIPWEKVKVDDLDGFSEGGMIDQETVDSEWETLKSSEPAKETTSQSPTVDTSSMITTQADAYSQSVTMLQIPVAQAVSAVGLVPPTFPMAMSIPPPGFSPAIPPPPFLRAGFAHTQPPPGFLPPPVVPSPAIAPTIPPVPTSLVQPPLSTPQESVKDVTYGGLVSPVVSVPSSLATPSIPPLSVFNTSTSTHSESDQKRVQSIDSKTSSIENNSGQGLQSDASGVPISLPGMQSTASIIQSRPLLNLPNQRLPGLLPIDIRPGMMPPSRFPFMIQPGMPPPPTMPLSTIPSFQPGFRSPFPPSDLFRVEGLFGRPSVQNAENSSSSEEKRSVGTDSIQQEGDRDYRFPPIENRERFGRLPLDYREALGLPSLDSRENQESIRMSSLDSKQSIGLLPLDSQQSVGMPPFDSQQSVGMPPFDSQQNVGMPPADSQQSVGMPPADSQQSVGMPPADSQQSVGRESFDSQQNVEIESFDSQQSVGMPTSDGQQSVGIPALDSQQSVGMPTLDNQQTIGMSPHEGQQNVGRPLLSNQQNAGRPPLDDQQNIGIPPLEGQQNVGMPPLEGQQNVGMPPLDGQQNVGMPPLDGQQNVGMPPLDGQQNIGRPPVDSRESLGRPPVDSRESLGRPPFDSRESLGRPPFDSRESFGRPPIDSRENFGRPPIDCQEGLRRTSFDSRESLGRPPLNHRDSFGRPPFDSREGPGRLQLDSREGLGRPHFDNREGFGRPPFDNREGFGRPPFDNREGFARPPFDNREGFARPPPNSREGFARPPLDSREGFGRPSFDAREGVNKRDHFGFSPDQRWGHRRDFDEREHRSMSFGSPKTFHENRERFGQGNFRFDGRGGPMWNRGFEPEAHRDFDDRRRMWDRQRDRNDRDLDFRREMNSNRIRRDREQPNWAPSKPPVFQYFEGTTDQETVDSSPQVNGDNAELDIQHSTNQEKDCPELSPKVVSTDDKSEEKNDPEPAIENQPVVESTETEGT
ncbi:SR-related and CTD-associated factor 8 isoform X3 [Latimeria chalumnae]|uniref:SR-related and CTD-associated factor 8 isoform X3 n=1 Tax=Latimeria chalumnae TaxID=7897 RepID=UPI00313AD880